MFIYLITNKVNGKYYVGQTRGVLSNRLREHFEAARAGSEMRLHQAIRKHGQVSFSIRELESCDRETVDAAEIKWIAELRSTEYAVGYNMSPGGFGIAEETRKKLSIAFTGNKNPMFGKVGTRGNLGKRNTPEARQRMSAGRRGKACPTSVYEANAIAFSGEGNPFFGKHHTEESKIKISQSKRGWVPSEAWRQKQRARRRNTSL